MGLYGMASIIRLLCLIAHLLHKITFGVKKMSTTQGGNTWAIIINGEFEVIE